MSIFWTKIKAIFEVIFGLKRQFDVKELREVKHYLGMTITRDRQKKKIKVSQSQYVQELLKYFNMEDSFPNILSLQPGHGLAEHD